MMPIPSPPPSRRAGAAVSRKKSVRRSGKKEQRPSTEFVSQREYARRKGWQPSYVNKLVKQGVIPLRKSQIDPVEADAAIARHRDPARRQGKAQSLKNPEQEATRLVAPDLVEPDEAELDGSVSYARARAVRETYRARREKVLYEQLQGRLLEAEDVKSAAFSKARIARDSLLNIPDRIAAVLAAEADQEKIHALLSSEIRQALEDLTGGLPPDDIENGPAPRSK